MPAHEKRDLRQAALLFVADSINRYGETIVSEPVEIRVRWTTIKTEATSAQENPTNITAKVIVDREIAVGSKMWLGELSDWYGTGSAGNDSQVMEVASYDEEWDLKHRFAERIVTLRKFNDTVPRA